MPALSRVDTFVLVISLIGATLLHFLRHARGHASGRGQWLNDALSVGTIGVLLLVACEAALGSFGLVNFKTVAQANGLVIVTAFIYCVVMISINLAKSIDPPRRR